LTSAFRDVVSNLIQDNPTAYGRKMAAAGEFSEAAWRGWARPLTKGLLGVGLVAGGLAAIPASVAGAGLGILSLADDVLLYGGLALGYRAAGGWQGLVRLGGGVAKTTYDSARFGGIGAERIARAALIGGIGPGGKVFGKGTNALDVWFPHLKGPYARTDVRRYALNTRVAPRLAGLLGAFGIAKGTLGAMGEFLGSASGPVTAYYDGSNIRHANDMGADASYARSVLGRNSGL